MDALSPVDVTEHGLADLRGLSPRKRAPLIVDRCADPAFRPLALPGKLALGKNRIRFVGGPVSSPIRTVCRWIERHRADCDVSLNSISYSMNGDEASRNFFVVAPGARLPVRVTLRGRGPKAEVSLENLPAGWAASPRVQSVDTGDSRHPAAVEFVLQPVVSSGKPIVVLRVGRFGQGVGHGQCLAL